MADEPKEGTPQTPTGRALAEIAAKTPEQIFKEHGIKGGGDEIIDVWTGDPEGAAIEADVVKHFGGEEGFATASAELREAVSVMDPEGKIGAVLEKMTRTEEAQAVKEIVQEWREVLASPEKAQAALQAIYAHPEREPGLSYFRGRASEAVNEAVSKLWQSTHGEPVTGRPKSKGDGWTY